MISASKSKPGENVVRLKGFAPFTDLVAGEVRRKNAVVKYLLPEAGASVRFIETMKANATKYFPKYALVIHVDSSHTQSEKIVDAMEVTFGLERDLQEALRKNIAQLEPGLNITDGGREHSVSSGRIDILATDAKQRRVVIELKAGTADRDAVGQILSYMGDLQDGAAQVPARGILVAADFTARAISAAKAVPNVELMKYAFKFSFQTVGS
ncbi:MAG: DUF91 domain-containing protein [Acidobacteria bacterium]|nr:DUF91 domain-containing protein [Acidobacteriota bacterium]